MVIPTYINHCRPTDDTCTLLLPIVTYLFHYPPHSSLFVFPFSEVESDFLAQRLLPIEVHGTALYFNIFLFLLCLVNFFFFILPKLIILGQEISSTHERFQLDTLARRCYKTTACFPFLFNTCAYHFILCPAITILRVRHRNFNFSTGLPASISIHLKSRMTQTNILFTMQSKAVGE